MRKLMKKKINVLGKEISVFLIALIGIGVVTAALVPYLSNVISGSATVSSPLQLNYTLATPCMSSSPNAFTCAINGGDIIASTGTLTNNGPTGTQGVIALVFIPPVATNFSGDNDGVTVTANGDTLDSLQNQTAVSSSGDYVTLAGGHFFEGIVLSDNNMDANETQGPTNGQVAFATNIYPGTYDVVIFAVMPGKTANEIAAEARLHLA